MNIYLCSRIRADALDLNVKVCVALRREGHEVFLPQSSPAQMSRRQDVIYKEDLEAMEEADACVVVPRIGTDCSWEIGWFCSRNIPVIVYSFIDTGILDMPMVAGGITAFYTHNQALYERASRHPLLKDKADRVNLSDLGQRVNEYSGIPSSPQEEESEHHSSGE